MYVIKMPVDKQKSPVGEIKMPVALKMPVGEIKMPVD